MAAAAAAAANLRRNREKDKKLKGKEGPEFQTPARYGWGQTARMLHGELAEIPQGPKGAGGNQDQANWKKKNKEALRQKQAKEEALARGSLENSTGNSNATLQKKARSSVWRVDDIRSNEDGTFQASASANVILYVGLGMIAIGLVITFVGLGDKGFKTLELKLIGPSLVGCGVFFALLRILFCTVPSCCRSCAKCCSKSDEAENLIKKDEIPASGVTKSTSNGGSALAPNNNVTGVYKDNGNYKDSRANAKRRREVQRANFLSDDEEEDHRQDGIKRTPGLRGSFRQNQVGAERSEIKNNLAGNRQVAAPAGQNRRSKPLPQDAYSTTSSSTFSVNEAGLGPDISAVPRLPHLGGSTKNLKSGGEIILNASKLHVEVDNHT